MSSPTQVDQGGLTYVVGGLSVATTPGATPTAVISSTGALAPLSVASTGAITGTSVVVSGDLRSSTSTALGVTSPQSLNPTLGQVFTITPTGAVTINAASAAIGSRIVLKVLTSGTSSYTITFGTNFLTTGTLASGTADAKTFIVSFIGDGTNLIEVSRTAAM